MTALIKFLTDADAPKRLERYLHEAIPLVTHMDVRVLSADLHGLLLEAPLAPNRNHIGTAFGASLHGLGMLACWGMVWLVLEDEPEREIVVADSRMTYRAPATGTFQARCPLPTPDAVQALREGYRSKSRARLALESSVGAGSKPVASFAGTFVALRQRA